jgi:uncharacterized protein (DUF885 family)
MRSISFLLFIAIFIFSCNNETKTKGANKDLASLFENYYKERLELIPLESTQKGDTILNDKLYADFTDSYRAKLRDFFNRYQNLISKFKREELNDNDAVSYDIFKTEMQHTIEGIDIGYFGSAISYPENHYMPFNQFAGLPITLGQLGSGMGSQPFKTVKDYDDWLKRASQFTSWSDSAIVYFRKGIAVNEVLPASLVQKMIPQMNDMIVTVADSSLFYGPVTRIPAGFPGADKQRFKKAYAKLILEILVPSYKKLRDFFQEEYLPVARSTTGIQALTKGADYYKYLSRYWTTTGKTPDEIYQTGFAEVKRIRGLMDSVKNTVKFSGDLKAFFQYMRSDAKFMPYKTAEEVLNGYRTIQAKIDPNLDKLFGQKPKSPFEIRQTEAFRAASASAEYVPASADGSRPGIFYVPIVDATKFNVTSGMEGLFLHEAIPGHHYQIALQQENNELPLFRRFGWYGAYGEGWALYTESLGKELGCYTDPYQYIGALGKEIHRSIRLVVDVGMHSKNMTREEAIKYMIDNMAISEAGATAEIERYMAIPGQALSYKIGSLKIQELRKKYEKALAGKFSLKAFHDKVLELGCAPLNILETVMDAWAQKQK